MGQRQAHQWSPVLWVVLPATRRTLGHAPTRSLTALAMRLGVAEAAASAMVVPGPGPLRASTPPTAAPAPPPAAPLVGMMAPHGVSGGPRLRLRRRAVIAGRKRATRSQMCGCSTPSSHSSAGASPLWGGPTTSGVQRPRRSLDLRVVGCSRTSASWRSRSTRSRSACRPASPEAEPSRAAQKPPIDASRVAACASNTSTAASSAAVWSTKSAASGRGASAT
jgi:hypothetical protein